MGKILSSIAFIISIFALSACRGPDPNPELKDPIYLDLVSDYKALEGAIKNAEKEIESQKKLIKSLPPRDPSRRQQIYALYSQEKKLLQLKQQAEYLKIRQERRKEHVRKVYPQYYEQNKPWPDENEVAEYKKLKELRSAPKSWDERIRNLKLSETNEAPKAKKN